MKTSNDALFEKQERVEVCETIAGRHAEIERLTREYLAGGGGISFCKPHLPKDHGRQTIVPKTRMGIPYMESGDRTGLPLMVLSEISGDDRGDYNLESPLVSQGSLSMMEGED